MLVLVLNALMPLAAQAMRASAGAGDAIEICTSTGMVRVPTNKADSSNGTDKSRAAQMQDCPFCQLHDDQPWLPPVPVALPRVQHHADMPPAFYQAARTSAVWLTALSRGPPSLLS